MKLMLLLYIIKQPPFFKVQKSRRVVSYKKHMTKRGYAFVDNSRFAFVITRAYAFVTRINITKRLLPLTNEAVRLSVVHERGFRPTCEVKTGTFGPRTTLCWPGTFRSPLKLSS